MANNPTLINYFNRDFESLRKELVNYVKNYHSDKWKYFSEASPDYMYLELLAYTGDSLNFQLDRAFNESYRGTAQARESLVRIAQDFGFNNFHAKPSTTSITCSISVPAVPNANGSVMIPDSEYLFSIRPGMIVQSDSGANFECLEEINFGHSFNRTIIPNFDSNGVLLDFTVEKTAVVTAGETRIQRFYVTQATSKPFLEIVLSDDEITDVLGVVVVPGNAYNPPSDEEFRADGENSYVQVEHLAQDKIFLDINPLPEPIQNIVNAYTDMTVSYGEWVNKPKRFMIKRDKNGLTSIVFGSTLIDYSTWNQVLGNFNSSQLVNFSLSQILNNKSLGEVPPIDSTLFIKYRAGAGVKTNVITNSINSIITKEIILPNTPGNLSTLEIVKNSLVIKSNLPAIGGTDAMSNEEIRNSIGKVFAANDRGVTYEDIKAIIAKMPARYGQPFRVSYEEIKPQLMSYNQIKNYVETKVDEMLSAVTSVDRELKAQELKSYLLYYPNQLASLSNVGQNLTIANITNGINTPNNIAQHKMWYGEKCRLHILGIDENLIPATLYKDENNVWHSPNEMLKQNIKNFLKEKRVIGDWIDIIDAKVVNFQVEFKVIVDKKNKQKVLIDCLTRLRDYFNVYNWQINQPIFIANVSTVLQEIDGVLNVVDLKFYNIFDKDLETGKEYSPKEIGRYRFLKPGAVNANNNKYEVETYNNVILASPDTFFNIRYPEVDIKGFVI